MTMVPRAAVAGLLVAALASQVHAEPAAAGPVVRLRADRPHALLQQQQQQTGSTPTPSWRDVCVAPCGTPVDPAALYRVGGGGFRDSRPFLLPRPAGEVTVDARMGSSVKHWLGISFTIGGGLELASGALLLALAPGRSGSFGGDTQLSNQEFFTISGITYLVLGAALLAIGIPLSTSDTHVEVR